MSDNNLVIPEYKIELLNKNKKTIHKIESIQSNISKINYNNKKFQNKKFKKNFKTKNKFAKKFKYYSKIKKNNFENKKLANY